MEKKKFGQTKVGSTLKKIATAPVRFVKKGIAKEKAYNAYKAEKQKRDIMNSL